MRRVAVPRGHPIEDDVNLRECVGKPCAVNVTHYEGSDGTTRADVDAVLRTSRRPA